jgi:hypothetical protein
MCSVRFSRHSQFVVVRAVNHPAASFIGKKRQNQQSPSREQAAPRIERTEEKGYDSWFNAAS